MTRLTSREAYRRIEQEGLLTKSRLEIYQIVYHNGPMTAMQIFTHLEGVLRSPGDVRSRCSELRELNVLKEVAIVVCPINGSTVIQWDVTDGLPIDLPRPETWKQIATRLQFENIELKKRLEKLENPMVEAQASMRFPDA